MTYGVVVNLAAPVEVYVAVHQHVVPHAGASVDGLLLHVGRASSDGFQIIEVWDSKEQYDHDNEQLVWPVMADLWGGAASALALPCWFCRSSYLRPAFALVISLH